MMKYQYARTSRGDTPEVAIKYAFNTAGVAMLVTTIVLAAGFLVLSRSTFAMNSDMGLLTTIVICFALLADFALLPIALLYFDRENRDEENKAGLYASN
jgi:predicted RND superfamily exporter protein